MTPESFDTRSVRMEALYTVNIKVRDGWVSRSKGLDDSANPHQWWNTTGDWKARESSTPR